MSDSDLWVFEGPDPEVGIFGDLIVHTCDKNEDELEAEQADVSVREHSSVKGLVEIVTTFRCPACGVQTTTVDQEPA